MKTLLFKFIFALSLLGITSGFSTSIQTTNKILARVGSQTITVLDVKKEMDRQLYMKDKATFNDPVATFTFYAQNWKMVLNKIVQDEMLVLEAEAMEYALPSHEITKRVTDLFGDNTVETLKFLSMTPETARSIANREILSEQLSWYQIWSKSFMDATPSTVFKAYEKHIAELELKDKWTYQALYVKSKEEGLVKDTSHSITCLLKESEFTNFATILDELDIHDDRIKVGVSKDITLEKGQISEKLLSTLEGLEEGSFSEVITSHKSDSFTGKILYMKGIEKERIPTFLEVSDQLKNALVNEHGGKRATEYYEGLYKKYDVDGIFGDKLATSTLEPFSIQYD